MIRRPTAAIKALIGTLPLIGFISKPTPLVASDTTMSFPVDQEMSRLKVRLYSFPGLPPWVLHVAEMEAARMLRPVDIQFEWVDCTAQAVYSSCLSPAQSTDLIVRFLAKALPKASPNALGIVGSSANAAVAFIFYDRIADLRTHSRLLPLMLGRVMAHEITHLLLPEQGHSKLGLMKAEWPAEDLEIISSLQLALPTRSIQLMQKEVLRRALTTHRGPGK